MKVLMFQARRFWFRSFQQTLETVEQVGVEVKVTGQLIIHCHPSDLGVFVGLDVLVGLGVLVGSGVSVGGASQVILQTSLPSSPFLWWPGRW